MTQAKKEGKEAVGSRGGWLVQTPARGIEASW